MYCVDENCNMEVHWLRETNQLNYITCKSEVTFKVSYAYKLVGQEGALTLPQEENWNC